MMNTAQQGLTPVCVFCLHFQSLCPSLPWWALLNRDLCNLCQSSVSVPLSAMVSTAQQGLCSLCLQSLCPSLPWCAQLNWSLCWSLSSVSSVVSTAHQGLSLSCLFLCWIFSELWWCFSIRRWQWWDGSQATMVDWISRQCSGDKDAQNTTQTIHFWGWRCVWMIMEMPE